jgi:hypothetical protein
MSQKHRLKKLEQRMGLGAKKGAVFLIKYHEGKEQKQAQERLKNSYLASGKSPAHVWIFINDFGAHPEERFLYEFSILD